ncbi:hypothetical protein HD597_006721 [Nonomuraea thailandensis]|uniref:Uncharacterized protein n=1 Tax=Nonomuraea thailandensis TaxID=1188745 RepID=A0A9X2GQ92_9ACTN|nr:hypothetical protein [Nonomuraea thailandensis]
MQALGEDHHLARARPAGVPVLPGDSAWVALLVSFDRGQTWRPSGTLNLPTAQCDTAARLFLMTAMSMATEDHALNVVWQVLAWPAREGQECPSAAPPIVSLRSDGEVPGQLPLP